MALIYTNGTLTAITAVGGSADYDDPATTGSSRWTGSVGVTVRGPRLEQLADGRVDEVIRTSVELPYDVGELVVRGDTLQYQFEGTSHSRTAGTIIRAAMAGRVRVLLEDA